MKLIAYIFVMLLPLFANGQQKPAGHPDYPQDYFRNPLDIPIFLAGNFGECRPGHFHSGVDIKTLGKEGQPVHAAADGYISRIKMEKGGFGHGLYITHPNGYTTLYAHLSEFAPALQKYLKKEQYAKKHWDVDIQLTPDQFPVKKGDQIAWSGNTGASTAPHLHFEIRNTKTEHPLNPELFGLPIVDNIAPVPVELVLYRGNIYTPSIVEYNGEAHEAAPMMASLAKAGNIYKPAKQERGFFTMDADTLNVPGGKIGVGLNVDDYMDGSDNTIAFYTAQVFMDDALQSEITLDDIGYDETRYINAYADYKIKETQHKWVQCFFQLPGNHLDGIFHSLNSDNGRLNLTDDLVHKVVIKLTDDRGNLATVQFYVRPFKVDDNMAPAEGCTTFHVNRTNEFNGDPNISFSLDAKQLYDDVCVVFKTTPDPKAYTSRYRLGDPWLPLHHYFDLQIKPNKTIPFDLRSKVVMMYSDDKDEDGRAAAFSENGWYKAKVRNFGTYWLDVDTTAPVIRSLQKNGANLSKAKQITFEAKDDATSVKSFGGYLDGKWLCFEQHGSSFFYKFDEHCSKGKHKLVFKAEDENGNEAVYELNFTK